MTVIAECAQAFAEIQEYVVKGAREIFAAFGMPVEYSPVGSLDIRGPAVMAVIGYAAGSMRGALLIVTSRDVVCALQPEEVRATFKSSEESLRDVLGEFSNMLAGRVKNQLISRRVAPLLTTPTTVFGDDLQLPVPVSGMSAWHNFRGARGNIFIRFDATFEEDFALATPPDAAPALAEGEMVLF
jgi:CheY-specific phosphatase CheX